MLGVRTWLVGPPPETRVLLVDGPPQFQQDVAPLLQPSQPDGPLLVRRQGGLLLGRVRPLYALLLLPRGDALLQVQIGGEPRLTRAVGVLPPRRWLVPVGDD